ncbi:MAG TPA: DUF1206 domain-containing protein [Solirubrobacteraceae bacterium]|jgi:hypothetical protein|nr:DUF1206 domain-containing protein [Solirubrobacteraceae bacterium]
MVADHADHVPSDAASARTLDAARSTGFAWFVMGGFVARGLVYAVIGGLALALALGAADGATTNQQGALALISRGPIGSAALGLLAVGLLAYAVWQIGQAVLGRGLENPDRETPLERIGQLGAGIAYVGVSVVAVKVLVGDPSSESSDQSRAAAGVLGWPAGQWIVGLAGVIFVGVCAYLAYDGLTGSYLDGMKTGEMTPAGRRLVDLVGRVGLTSRAVVFALIGYFLIRTAIDFDPAKTIGLDGALRKVADRPYGSWLLGLVAIGLIAFAFASFAEARYREL